MSAVWKKVLLAGEVDLTSGDVSGNQGDVLTASNSGLNAHGATNNVLIGDDGDDLNLEVDIVGLGAIGAGSFTSSDFVMMHDASASIVPNDSGNKLVKVPITDIINAGTSGVTAFTVEADEPSTEGGPTTSTATSSGGSAALQLSGGEGITTELQGSTNHVEIQADRAVVSTTATSGGSFGSVLPSTSNFDLSPQSFLRVKADGIGANEVADGSLQNIHINANANIADTKLATIDTTGKVDVNALDIDGAISASSTAQLGADDLFVLHDGGGSFGSAGGFNYSATLGQISAFVGADVATIGDVHSGLTAPGNVDEGVLTYVSDVTFDAYGHVTNIGTDTIPDASVSATGVVNTNDQSFKGVKTFGDIRVVNADGGAGTIVTDGNVTIGGDLVVQGETTTLNVGTLNVEDKTIVAGTPETAYATTPGGADTAFAAANGAGFFAATYHGANTDKFAGVQWNTDGKLTGWSLRDSAANDGTEAITIPAAVMEFGTAGPGSGDNAAGVGSFFMDTTGDDLYIRVA